MESVLKNPGASNTRIEELRKGSNITERVIEL